MSDARSLGFMVVCEQYPGVCTAQLDFEGKHACLYNAISKCFVRERIERMKSLA